MQGKGWRLLDGAVCRMDGASAVGERVGVMFFLGGWGEELSSQQYLLAREGDPVSGLLGEKVESVTTMGSFCAG